MTSSTRPSQAAFHRFRPLGVVTLGYVALAAILTWPLLLHLRTQLPGDPAGDTGIYVWNLWVFSRELIGHGRLPFSTDYVFPLSGGVDFSLHNYTPLAGLLAVPLIPTIGVVGAYNVVLLFALTMNGLAVYGLTRTLRVRRWFAWVAGALFMGTPLISAREVAHLSLVCAAALPLFLIVLQRCLDAPSLGKGTLLGVIVAAATYSDVYFGVYCVLMGAFVVAWQTTSLRANRIPDVGRIPVALNTAILCLAAGLAVVLAIAVYQSRTGSATFRPDRAYAPSLALVILVIARAWLAWRPRVTLAMSGADLRARLRVGIVGIGVCLVLLAPIISGLTYRMFSGRLPSTATLWRSSPRGVDLLAFLVPNPVHAALRHYTDRMLLPSAPDAFPELVASCSLVALAVVGVGIYWNVLPRMWVAFTAFFAALSLGPFIHIAGINTTLIGPWALLRYVPLVGTARSPARFAIVAALGLSVLFALALEQWHARERRHRRLTTAAVLALLAIELVPGTRTLHAVDVPEVYRLIRAQDDQRGRLLELPTGVRDGTSSIGDFSASTAFFQTVHEVPVVGGYVSRVSERRKRDNMQIPMLRALFTLSEGRALSTERAEAAQRSRRKFMEQSCVRHVVIDKRRASPDLLAFAIETLRLSLVHEDGRHALYIPDDVPPCQAPPRRSRPRGRK